MKNKIKNVAIIGMGALGLMYGKILTDGSKNNENISFVMDEKRAAKALDSKFYINGQLQEFNITTPDNVMPADLILVCVKYTGLKNAIEMMKPCIGPDTIIMSVLNGISSETLLGEAFGFEHIIYTVAQAMDAMKFDNNLKFTQIGELHIGITKNGSLDDLKTVKNFFDSVSMPYIIEDDIMYRMWCKFMLNVGINQTCMVYNTNYKNALSKGEANRTLISAMREVIALANAEGIALTEKDLNFYIEIIKTLCPTGTPSMGQDRINKRPSEVESFSGTVISLAKKHNLLVPVNEFLYEKVKEIESMY